MIHVQLVKLVDPIVNVKLRTRLSIAHVLLVLLEYLLQSKDVFESLIPAQELSVLRDTNVSRDFVCWDAVSMGIVLKENSVSMECALNCAIQTKIACGVKFVLINFAELDVMLIMIVEMVKLVKMKNVLAAKDL